MFGKVKVVSAEIKTASVTKKADGYYLTLSLEDKTVPEIKPIASVNS
jgi:putative transposase